MNPQLVIVLGAGGHALVVADAIRACGIRIFGFVDTISPERKGHLFNGTKIIGGFDEMLEVAKDNDVEVALGFGQCVARNSVLNLLKENGIRVCTVVHPRATVSSSAQLSTGVYVGPNAVIESDCHIGAGCIINCGAAICHECSIGVAVAVCPGVLIGGKTKIGDKTWLGIGATVIDKINIGKGCFVGAGAVVVSDLPDNVLALGVPARISRPISTQF